jgi:hypothetical protein
VSGRRRHAGAPARLRQQPRGKRAITC